MDNWLPTIRIVFGFAACAAFFVVFVVMALIQVSRTQMNSPIIKLLWVVLIVFAPFIGSLLWFGFGTQVSEKLQPA